jgi:hypothetical protein
MSIFEIFYRIRHLLQGYREEKFGYRPRLTDGPVSSAENILGLQPSDPKTIPDNIKIFGTKFDFSDPSSINWHQDILSGEVFKNAFYTKINIREKPNLSAKCVWEINRLQFLTGICFNYRNSGNKNHLDLFMQLNKSWSEQNPFMVGVNWYSNIEINLRLINWFLCWEILDTENLELKDQGFKEFVQDIWLPLIEKHCIYSYMKPSKYSSANNHLISEYAGLFIASSKWKFRESEKWINYSRKGLEKEIILQHSSNGINREEAAEYIQFITDFFLLSFLVGGKTGRPFSDQFRQQLYKIFSYIHDFLDINDNFPKYGDEDDGRCFILGFDEKFNNFTSLLTSGAVIFNDQFFKKSDKGFDIKNKFLFGKEGSEIYDALPHISLNMDSRFFREEGHFIFRKQENGKEIYLHFDAAPLGYLSIAAHGHADALSFLLNVDGHPLFIDSGTYTYHTDPIWRKYFIGTISHNTIRIGGKNQAMSGGPTLWVKHYKTEITDLESDTSRDRVRASHNGYLSDGAKHIREIIFDRSQNEFQILDTIVVSGKRSLQVEIPFHLHPDITIENTGENFYSLSEKEIRSTEFKIDEKLNPVLITGQTEPDILGWYSESFLKKEAAKVIYCKTVIDITTTFKFIIKII